MKQKENKLMLRVKAVDRVTPERNLAEEIRVHRATLEGMPMRFIKKLYRVTFGYHSAIRFDKGFLIELILFGRYGIHATFAGGSQ